VRARNAQMIHISKNLRMRTGCTLFYYIDEGHLIVNTCKQFLIEFMPGTQYKKSFDHLQRFERNFGDARSVHS